MLKVDIVIPKVLHTIDCDLLDELKHPLIVSAYMYDEACKNKYNLIDYRDGDFKWRVNLSDNTTPWIQVLKEHLPQVVIDENKFAIYFINKYN